jgi:transposase
MTIKGTRKKTKLEFDYDGIKIRIGIDAHLRQWNITIYIGNRFHKTFQQSACPETLYKYVKKNFPGGKYESCYEAGYFGYTAHRQLEKLGIENIVVNASDVPTTDKEKRRKSDKLDSKKLAKALLTKTIGSIYIPSQEMEADRRLVRYRTKNLRKQVTQNKQRLKAFLVMTGKHKEIDGYDKSYWSKKLIEQIQLQEFENRSDKIVLEELLNRYESLRQQMKKINREIVLLSRTKRYEKLVGHLKSIPGIGLLTAMVMITEIWDMSRFKTLDKLCSFVGIVPDTSCSDTRETIKGLTRRANVELRRLLIQSSWVASSRCTYMASIYQKHKKKREQKGIIKVARKILSILRAVWLKEENYEIEKMYTV